MDVITLFLKKFFHRIVKDLRHKELLPLKLLFFVHASTIFVLYPYLTIHARELGISVEETAIMSAVTPVVAIIMPPLAGMVADKIGNFKVLLALFSGLGGGASLLLLLVPVGRVTITYPTSLVMDLGCSSAPSNILPGPNLRIPLQLGIVGTEPCHQVNALNGSKVARIETLLESCGFVCQPTDQETSEDMARILHARSYDVSLSAGGLGNITDTYSYTLSGDKTPLIHGGDLRENRFKQNQEHFRTSIRNLTSSSFFFPTTGLYNLTCGLSDGDPSKYDCRFVADDGAREGVGAIPVNRVVLSADIATLRDAAGVSSLSRTQFVAQAVKQWQQAGERTPWNNLQLFNATCSNEISDEVSVSVPLRNPNNSLEIERHLQLGRCQPRCLVTVPRKQICSNDKHVIEYDVKLTFWTYLIIRVFIGVIGGTAFAMFEGAVIAILREHKADYGLQRIYATIGGMISSPLSGMLIDYASRGKDYTDFRPAFYLYAALKIASGFLMLNINLEFKSPATNVVRDVLYVLKNVEIIALFIALFVMGTAWGYLESFLFWLLQDLGASRSLMGITITVGGIAGIPLLVLSGPIINRIGHANVLFIGFIFYGIRLMGYSLIYDPWLCLIFEAMESVTSSLSFTAAVTYAARLSTMSTDSSIQGLLGGLYYGVGKGAGSLIGGYMMTFFGTRETYRIFAVVCVVVGTIYFLFNRFYLRKRPRREGNDIVKKKPKNVEKGAIDIGQDSSQQTNEKGKPINNRIPNESLPIGKSIKKTYGNGVNDVKAINEINKNITKSLNEAKDNNKARLENGDKVEENCSINLGYIDDVENVKVDDKQEEKNGSDVPKVEVDVEKQSSHSEDSKEKNTDKETKNDAEKHTTH